MVTIRLLPWEEARAHAAPIRFAVFVEEQGVPAQIELDEMDEASLHALAFQEAKAVGTARLLPDGGLMLARLIEAASTRGHREVVLSAQVHAAGFYRAHGFVEQGDEYLEAGIPHREMRRAL